jgi:ketosteroid isomerase-like protein
MTDNVEILRAMARTWAAGDQLAAMDYVAPDVVIVQPESLPWGGEHHGHDGMNAMFAAMYQDLDQDMERMTFVGSGDKVVTMQGVTWRNRKTGATASVPRVEVVTFADGKATRFDVYLKDVHALLSIL